MLCRIAQVCFLWSSIFVIRSRAQDGNDTYFTDFEALVHSVVEYIPGVGTAYAIRRSAIAIVESRSKYFWASVADSVESVVRDIILVAEYMEPAHVVAIHSVTESLTEKSLELYHSKLPSINISRPLNRQNEYIIIGGPQNSQHKETLFDGVGKGVLYFFNATFSGLFQHPQMAPDGEEMQIHIPQGFRVDAPMSVTFKYLVQGVKEAMGMRGFIQLEAGARTKFRLRDVTTFGSQEEGWDFWGTIHSRERIFGRLKSPISETTIDFKRLETLPRAPGQAKPPMPEHHVETCSDGLRSCYVDEE